jgi:hypothetical protein
LLAGGVTALDARRTNGQRFWGVGDLLVAGAASAASSGLGVLVLFLFDLYAKCVRPFGYHTIKFQ